MDLAPLLFDGAPLKCRRAEKRHPTPQNERKKDLGEGYIVIEGSYEEVLIGRSILGGS